MDKDLKQTAKESVELYNNIADMCDGNNHQVILAAVFTFLDELRNLSPDIGEFDEGLIKSVDMIVGLRGNKYDPN